jgi:DNA-binding transcriptional MerR regulator
VSAQPAGAAQPDQPAAPAVAGGILPTSSIGDVLRQLQADFPDVTVSKIRFWENEGLITPKRSKSGYRRFSPEDISRLRYILTRQRDSYLPLKVIKEQLDAMDSGKVTPVTARKTVAGAVSPDQFRAAEVRRLTRDDVAARSGAEDSLIAALVRMEMITPDAAGFFSADDIDIVRLADSLVDYGIDKRNLKTLVTMARRQVDLVSRITEPLAHSRDENARERAAERAREISALVVSLNASMVKANLPH